MPSPHTTTGSPGNALASQSVAAGASVTFNVDFSLMFEGELQIGCSFGTVSATAGLQIQVFPRVGSTPVTDTVPGTGSTTIAAASVSSLCQTIRLQTGRYMVKLTNLDASNGLLSVYATYDAVDYIS